MIILTGASATGKTEIGKALNEQFNIKKVVTYTTRPKRSGEVDGLDYNFLTLAQFEEYQKNDFFFETMSYNGNFYGTSKKSLIGDVYLIVDPNGLRKYRASNFSFKAFYLKCDESIREARMITRGDSLSGVISRIELDRVVFNEEIEALADYVIDVSNDTISEIAKAIYETSKE